MVTSRTHLEHTIRPHPLATSLPMSMTQPMPVPMPTSMPMPIAKPLPQPMLMSVTQPMPTSMPMPIPPSDTLATLPPEPLPQAQKPLPNPSRTQLRTRAEPMPVQALTSGTFGCAALRAAAFPSWWAALGRPGFGAQWRGERVAGVRSGWQQV